MTYTLKDIQHLSVMADLANAKPIAKPQVDIKKLLASDTAKELTVHEKILTLCSKLRAEGFDKQASALEHKFLDYKTANVHLYRVIDEDGEDLINAAHPDGEVKVEEATGDLGTVETILTEHKKLVDIVNKSPKAKHASDYQEAIKFITAQNTNELGTVNLLDISKKFKYISDYLTTHFLTDVPEGQTLPPESRSFYGIIGLWRDLTNQVATELNHDKVVPLVQGIQLVKNRLFSASFENAKQYAQKINSVADIDKLVSWILSWAEDNNPIKKANTLFKYVLECKTALNKTAGPGLIPFVLWIWSKTNRFNHGVKSNTEILISELDDIFTKPEITRSADALKKLQDTKTKLQKLKEYTIKYDSIETSPTAKDLEFIAAYESFIKNLVARDLIDLNNMMARLRRQDEEGTASSVYRVFVASDFEDVQKAIAGLNKAMADMMSATATARAEAAKSGVAVPTADENVLSGGPSRAEVESAIKQLNTWLATIPEPKKTKVAPWLQAQVKDFQDNANNPEKLKQLLKENEEFKAAWGV